MGHGGSGRVRSPPGHPLRPSGFAFRGEKTVPVPERPRVQKQLSKLTVANANWLQTNKKPAASVRPVARWFRVRSARFLSRSGDRRGPDRPARHVLEADSLVDGVVS